MIIRVRKSLEHQKMEKEKINRIKIKKNPGIARRTFALKTCHHKVL